VGWHERQLLPDAPASLPFGDAYFDEVHWCEEEAPALGGPGTGVEGAAAAAAAQAAPEAAAAAATAGEAAELPEPHWPGGIRLT